MFCISPETTSNWIFQVQHLFWQIKILNLQWCSPYILNRYSKCGNIPRPRGARRKWPQRPFRQQVAQHPISPYTKERINIEVHRLIENKSMITHRVRWINFSRAANSRRWVKVQRKRRLITALLQNVNLRWMTWKKSTWLRRSNRRTDLHIGTSVGWPAVWQH